MRETCPISASRRNGSGHRVTPRARSPSSSRGETAIVGDLVVGRFNAPRKPAYPLWVKDPWPVRASVKKVLAYSPKTLLSGHGGPLDADDVRRFFSLV